MPELIHSGNGGGYEHCSHCGALAIGPCARCQAPVCGDCSVLTEGGTKTFAICLGCDERSGRSLRRAWLTVIGWIVLPIAVLLAIVVVLELVRR